MVKNIEGLSEVSMKVSIENGYVVIPVEEYRKMILSDIRNLSTVKLDDSKWSYGDLSIEFPKKYITNIFSGTIKELYPKAIIDDSYNASITIGKIPKDIMDSMLGKEPEAVEEE